MKKFNASIEELFSAEAEALTSNSADYIINQFQTNEQENTQHPAANNGRKQGSRTGNAAAFDPAIPGVPEGYSEESENDTGGSGSRPGKET